MPAYEDRYAESQDGLRLHFRDYAGSTDLPVICLPGLSRTTADFATLAEALQADGRRVVAIDSRGRGLSDFDPEPANYNLGVESADVLTVLASLRIEQAVFVGTSRGGMITMLLAPQHRALIRGAVLNDIGPVLERAGLERIRGYVGKLPQPRSWTEAVDLMKRVSARDFPALSEADWHHWARLTFREQDGCFVTLYDPALSRVVGNMDLDKVPTLWPQFEALASAPALVLRGKHSDLLSAETAAEMSRRHPDCTVRTVPGQGHAPLLIDQPTIAAIRAFVAGCSPL